MYHWLLNVIHISATTLATLGSGTKRKDYIRQTNHYEIDIYVRVLIAPSCLSF